MEEYRFFSEYKLYKPNTPEGKFASAVAHFLAVNGVSNVGAIPCALQLIQCIEKATKFGTDAGMRELINAMKDYNKFCDEHHPTFTRYDFKQFED